MKFGLKGQIQSEISVPQNRFNDYSLNNNFNYEQFLNFIKTTSDENNRRKEEKEKEKNEFMRINFPNEKADISNEDLYKKIEQNRKDIISKDPTLYGKVERLLPLLKSGNDVGPAKPAKQSSGIYDFTNPKDDSKIFSNNTTPGVGY